MTFSTRLRNLLEERGLTQKGLAQQLGIPVSTLGGYVQGTSEPDFQTLKILATYFNVSLDYLLDYQYVHTKENTSIEDELLRIFRKLTPQQQEIYIDQGKSFLRINRIEDNIKP